LAIAVRVHTESHSFGNCFNHWSYELE